MRMIGEVWRREVSPTPIRGISEAPHGTSARRAAFRDYMYLKSLYTIDCKQVLQHALITAVIELIRVRLVATNRLVFTPQKQGVRRSLSWPE